MGNSCPNGEYGSLDAGYYAAADRFSEFAPAADVKRTAAAAAILRCGFDPHSISVLGHKTPYIRDLFEIGDKLGQGEFGTTYLCKEYATGAEYACKTILKRRLVTTADVEDIRREIQVLHHLSGNQSVVGIKGAFEDAGAVHIVMELCNGGELFDHLNERGAYEERQAAKVFKVVVEVVAACHALGVMHRDLKPENFLLADKNDNLSLKAIDFGLSVFFKPGQVFSELVGSPFYIAPEVLHKRYGPEVDIWSAGVILYILLSGVPPFWAETQQGIFDAVRSGYIDFSSDPWPQISDNAKDLIRKMLCPQPSERLKIHEVMSHPWMCENGVALDLDGSSAVVQRLTHFATMNKFKKLALRVIARSLLEEEVAGLKAMFNAMDTANNGAITIEELKEGLRKFGYSFRDNEIHKLIETADIDNNGMIDYGEFVAATVHLSKLEREEYLVAAFSYFDKDGSGYLTTDQLQQAFRMNGLKDVSVEDIIKEVDQNDDGQIDYDEFVSMMKTGNSNA